MPRSRPLLALAVAGIVAAVAVPGVLLARVARADVAVEVVEEPRGRTHTVFAPPGGSGGIELRVGPFPPGDGRRYGVEVHVSANRARSSFVLELLDERRNRLARCSFARGDYRIERHSQAALLECPVAEPEALRVVVVHARTPDTPAAVGVRRRPDGRFEAGGLLAVQPPGVSAALERLAVARPAALGPLTMLAALGLSTGLLAAVPLALGLPRRRDGVTGRGVAGRPRARD